MLDLALGGLKPLLRRLLAQLSDMAEISISNGG